MTFPFGYLANVEQTVLYGIHGSSNVPCPARFSRPCSTSLFHTGAGNPLGGVMAQIDDGFPEVT